jgi:hypothetical protein
MPLLLKFACKALTNVDDPAGRWQFEGGSVTQENKHVANYASFKRVTFQGTDQDNQNTASVTLALARYDPGVLSESDPGTFTLRTEEEKYSLQTSSHRPPRIETSRTDPLNRA